MENNREIDLDEAYDASEIEEPEFGISISGRGLIYYVKMRE